MLTSDGIYTSYARVPAGRGGRAGQQSTPLELKKLKLKNANINTKTKSVFKINVLS
jgi:hypothetical protein